MASAPTSQTTAPGVQYLLDAEKEAEREIQASRQYRIQRLKDAHTGALKEIEALKQGKHEEFKAYEQSLVGGMQETVAQCEADKKVQIEEIRKIAGEKSNDIVKMLLETVTNIKPALHENVVLQMNKQ